MIIKSAEYVKGATKVSDFPKEERVEFVFCGRSNVGKSSFINMICNRKALAKTSSKPGKTRVLNIFSINDDIYFVDIPGYGYANVNKEQIKSFGIMVEDYFKNSKNLACAFLLVDSRHEPTKDDVTMLEYFRYYHINYAIVLTKCDQVSNNKMFSNLKAIKNKLNLTSDDDIILASNMDRRGIEDTYKVIEKYMNM